MIFLNKFGKLSVEQIAIIILALAVLLILFFISGEIRGRIMEGLTSFADNVLTRRG